MSRRLSLALLVVAALAVTFPPAAAGGACHAGTSGRMTTSSDGEVAIAGCAFADTVTYVDPGDSVTWVSEDTLPHTVTGAARAWGDVNVLELGDQVSYTFQDEGVYPYFCELHPSMVAAVVVGDGKGAKAATGGIDKVDLAAAAASDETPSAGGGGSSVLVPASVLATLAGLALVVRLTLRRRAPARTA